MTASPPCINPYAGCDVAQLLLMRARALGERKFLTWAPPDAPVRHWSYGEFYHDVCAVAAGLSKRGLSQGDRLLIHMDNCPEFLIAWHACARLGVVAVTTNTKAVGAELAYFIEHSASVAAITQVRYFDVVSSAGAGLQWIVCADAASSSEGLSFATLFADPDASLAVSPDPARDLSIQYTSGTTARPKAVVWTHANGLWGAQAGALNEGLRGADAHLVVLPLFHTNALSYSMLAALWAGARIVVQPKFSASRYWQIVHDQGCTWSSLVGFNARALMDHWDGQAHGLRVMSFAVGYPPVEEAVGVKTMGLWGMTETITQAIVTDLNAPTQLMSIGRPMPAYDLVVCNADGRLACAGETGRLLIRGVQGVTLFDRYLDDEAGTASAFDEHGYFQTGDRVTLLENGELRFADREKDMLKVGGENVAASEVEAVIAQVVGVREVAVVAKADAMLDEVPVAFVIAAEDVAGLPADLALAITRACAQNLAPFNRPREVRIVDDLPRVTLEKVAKAQLPRQLQEEAARPS